jgi:hypothetical protein
MKKVLFGASALLAATAFSANANAAEPLKLQLGGYMDWYVAAVDQEEDLNKETNTFDVIGDGEIHFLGETVLDNGIKVGVQVELEGGNRDNTDAIDESFVTVDTSYGRVMIGSTDSVGYLMHAAAPDVGRLGVEESNIHELFVKPANAVTYLDATSINTDGDANKISYITPTMYGATFGVTYVPGAQANNADEATPSMEQTGDFEEGYVMSAMYSNEFAGVGVTVTGAYATYNTNTAAGEADENRNEVSVGTNLTYGGFTFGAGYRQVNDSVNSVEDAALASATSQDGHVWNAGVSYEAGPYGVSLAYMNSEVEGKFADKGQDEMEMYLLSGKYNLGAGVDTFASLGYVEYTDEAKTAAQEANGWALVTGVALAF